MSEVGPSVTELDRNSRKKVESPSLAVVLPHPPDKHSFRFLGRPGFVREHEVSGQEKFGEQVKNVILAPVRGELQNGNLAQFLRQLHEQTGLDQDKLGVVLLVNDNKKDKNNKDLMDENRATLQYLSFLSSSNKEGIEEMDVPQEYKDLAKEIIDKGKLEVRSDYLHKKSGDVHYGDLRAHLLKLIGEFKNPNVAGKDMIAHLSDVDTVYPKRYFQELKGFYEDESHQANLSSQDALPGVHEGQKKEDISRDVLLHFDSIRVNDQLQALHMLLKGMSASFTPLISGRLSYLLDENKKLLEELHTKPDAEDFFIGETMRQHSHLGTEVGNEGELYTTKRVRTPKGGKARTDADTIFMKVDSLRKGGSDLFGEKAEEDFALLEQRVALALNEENPEERKFKESDEYRQIFMRELKREQTKIRLRRVRLVDYVDSLAGKKEIPGGEQRILNPYIEYFQDETDEMKKQLNEGKTPEQVSVSYIHKYDSFFNSDADIHMHIARLRALSKYAFAHNLGQ